MRMQKINHIEKAKTILLVVLFFTTILLLYLLWSSEYQSRFNLPDILSQREQVQVPEVENVVLPSKVVYSFGDGSFKLLTKNPQEVVAFVVLQLKELNETANKVVSEITAEQFKEVIDQYKSAFISFDYGIPFDEFCLKYDIYNTTEFDSIMNINLIAFSEADQESIFIYDDNRGKYYRIVSGKESTAVQDLSEIITRENATVYYRVGSIFGGENDSLIPLILTSKLLPIYYKEESEEASKSVRKALAESLFGENFDFVRRITDNFGNVTYMYGYGQKTLTNYIDGVLEYKSEVLSGTRGGFYGDLETALSFVATHGTWDSLDGQDIEFYLVDAKEISEDKKSGYEFSFGTFVFGEKVFYEKGFPIEVKILDGQVAYYKRNVISIYDGQGFRENSIIAQDPANVIAQNYNYIYNVMTNNALAVNEDKAFEYVAASVSSVETGLVRIENDSSLQPAWIIHTDQGSSFYFSLYEARPIGLKK
ncbi:MAG: hypothetical protein EOM59_05615 [Clostridia bacterium]|nr:hypothetical protein [Clostridia bacterium]